MDDSAIVYSGQCPGTRGVGGPARSAYRSTSFRGTVPARDASSTCRYSLPPQALRSCRRLKLTSVPSPHDKPRIVGYTAKWHENSFEFQHTPRSFDFPAKDAGCWPSWAAWRSPVGTRLTARLRARRFSRRPRGSTLDSGNQLQPLSLPRCRLLRRRRARGPHVRRCRRTHRSGCSVRPREAAKAGSESAPVQAIVGELHCDSEPQPQRLTREAGSATIRGRFVECAPRRRSDQPHTGRTTIVMSRDHHGGL